MADFQIVHDPELEARTNNRQAYTFLVDGSPSLRWFPNGKDAERPDRSPTYFVDRCIGRLKAGRSAEAFGDGPTLLMGTAEVSLAERGDDELAKVEEMLLDSGTHPEKVAEIMRHARNQRGKGRGRVFKRDGPAVTETVTLGSGKTKQRERGPGYKYKLDGVESEKEYASEAEARAACAIQAFMSRGKLGKMAEAQAALEAQHPGQAVRVFACPKDHCIKATVDGERYEVGFKKAGESFVVERFKRAN